MKNCLSILFFCIALQLAAQTVYVPANHWVYDYLDRLETKRIIPVVLNGTKPMSRAEIAACLQQVEPHVTQLSKIEQEQFHFLQIEFVEELHPQKNNYSAPIEKFTRHALVDAWLPDILFANNRDLLPLQLGPLSAHINPVISRSRLYAEADTLTDTENVFVDANGVQVWGSIYQLGYFVDVRDSREWGTRAYANGNTTAEGSGFVQGNGAQIYHDESLAYITWHYKNFDAMFGKADNRWGPGAHGQLMLSDHATSYDQVKLQLLLPTLKFTFVAAWLRHYTPEYFWINPLGKMLAAHRIEFSPWQWLDMGLHESIIYKGETLKPAYANPLMFLRSAEHYLGDMDNATMGLDFELKVVPQTKIYGELFLDDITTSKIGTDFYGLKTAWQLGLFYVDVAGLPNVDARIEYTRLRPYVYSHKFDVTSYSHFDTGLGHWAGPNAENLYTELNWRTTRAWQTTLFTEWLNNAENMEGVNWGGDWHQPHLYDDPINVPFLSGLLTRKFSYGFSTRYELLREMYIFLNANFIQWKTAQQPLNHRTELQIGLSWNY